MKAIILLNRMYKSASKGVNRVTWNFTYESISPVTTTKFEPVSAAGGRRGGGGIQAMPGNYKVSLSLFSKGETKELAGPVPFVCKPLGTCNIHSNRSESKIRMD